MKASPISPTIPLDEDGIHHGFLKLPYSRDDSAWGSLMIPICVVKKGDGPTALLTGGVVTSLEVAGIPVELNETYRIATNNFLAGGGDFYSAFEEACNESDGYCRDSGILILDAFIENFSSTSPVFQGTDNRLIAE